MASTGYAQQTPLAATETGERAQPLERSFERQGVFGGKPVTYVAALETFDIEPEGDRSGASLAAFSYVTKEVVPDGARPVLFVFNGGPISASLWLHIGAVGPQRLSAPDDLTSPLGDHQLVDNPYSPLDAADLVFFDPASTGFSRVDGEGDAASFFSVEADAAQFVDFVDAWLERHGRVGAPVYILGESYGTMRAAEAAGQMAEDGGPAPAAGVFLMGQAVNIIEYAQRRQNIISYVVSLPTLAAMGWEQNKVDRRGRNFDAFIADAADFGETDYLVALFQGNRLSDEEMRQIAEELEGCCQTNAKWSLFFNEYTGLDGQKLAPFEEGGVSVQLEATS